MKFNKIPTLFFGLLLLAGIVLSCRKETTPDMMKDGSCGRLFFCVEAEDYEIPLRKDVTVGLFFSPGEGGGLKRLNEMMVIGENGETLPERDTVVGAVDGLLYAYSPYTVSWEDALESVKEFSVQKDQSAELAYRESDLMWAAEVAVTKPSTKVTLFHAMARIVIHMTSHSPEDDMRNVKVSLCDRVTGCHVFLREQSLQPDTVSVSDVRCHMVDAKDTRASLTAVIPPQSVSGGRLGLKISMAGDTYEYDIPVAETFESGKLYVYALSFADDRFVFEGGNVSDWTDGQDDVLDIDPSES